MNRICIQKSTKQILEMQSGGDDIPELMESRLNTLKQNAINAGYVVADLEVKWATEAEYAAARALDPNEIADKQRLETEKQVAVAKQQSISTNLPSWSQVSTAVDNISNLAEAKTFIKKLARVTYWLAKNMEI